MASSGTRAVDRPAIDTADYVFAGKLVGGERTGPDPIPMDRLAETLLATEIMSSALGDAAAARTVSTEAPSGVPLDGEEWIVVDA